MTPSVRRLAAAARLIMLAMIAACASSPEPKYYAMAPVPGTASGPGPRIVKLRRPGLAGYLDRSNVVRQVVDYRLHVQTGERWGEPLGDMVGRVLAQDLALRLPSTSVYTEAGAITADADATVEVDVQRFDAGADGAVTLQAEVAVERGQGHAASASQNVMLQARPAGPSTAELVGAMSGLVGELADRIAVMLRAPPPAG